MKNIAIAALVLVLLGAGYYIWSMQQQNPATTEQKQEVQKQPTINAKTESEVKVIPEGAVFEDGTIE